MASDFVAARVVERLLGCRRDHVIALAEQGLLGVKQLPGGIGTRRYSRADAERIANEMIRPARRAKADELATA